MLFVDVMVSIIKFFILLEFLSFYFMFLCLIQSYLFVVVFVVVFKLLLTADLFDLLFKLSFPSAVISLHFLPGLILSAWLRHVPG